MNKLLKHIINDPRKALRVGRDSYKFTLINIWLLRAGAKLER